MGMFKACVIAFLLAAAASVGAKADVRTYCEAYARDAATAQLSGSAILTGVRTPVSPEHWAAANGAALADCLAAYAEPAPPQKVVVLAPSNTPAAKPAPTLTLGSDAWKDYCAKKYTSFNRETGLYTGKSGTQRPCVVSKN